jgi:hypothetical protein
MKNSNLIKNYYLKQCHLLKKCLKIEYSEIKNIINERAAHIFQLVQSHAPPLQLIMTFPYERRDYNFHFLFTCVE